MTTATAPLSPTAGRAFWQESLFLPNPASAELPVVQTKIAPPAPPADPVEAPKDLSHTWVVAAEIEVEPRIASIADFRGSFKTYEGQRVDALEVYCRGCRRPYDEVKGKDCDEKVDNRHLIGGDQSIRKKRKLPPPPKGAAIIPGGTIQRRGINAYMAGVTRPR
ncbi:hypothetical protein OG413_20345 [Streptomyces sp. NBC_01433]|uniref:hypothetical protein n=1 Tax=Streptomyces sp. NBC_01433 TaxID=2903864 RepID=UPI0022506059|nr:hypothetical protein [Streptomyces sp. NBC_01433]MCX4677625.1 hypothetical protein [Streptomyces sp. NBC_01433]